MPSEFHPRITINPVSLGSCTTTEAYLSALAEMGVPRAGVGRPRMVAEGWDASLRRIDDAAVDVVYLSYNVMYRLDRPETWPVANEDVAVALDAAAARGWSVYAITGPGAAIGMSWEESTRAFLEASAPAARRARELGVPLMLEPTLPLFADLHYLHTLRDTLDVAQAAGMGLCVEVNASWMERDLRTTIEQAGALIGLVQLSDYIPSWRSTDRAIPGEGVVPLERIIGWILETGYDGVFDIELWGDQRADERDAIRRAADHVGRILDRLGARA